MIPEEELDTIAKFCLLSFPEGAVEAVTVVDAAEGVIKADVKYLSNEGAPIPLVTEGWSDPKDKAHSHFTRALSERVEKEWDARSNAQPPIRGVFELSAEGAWHLKILDPAAGAVCCESRGRIRLSDLESMADEVSPPETNNATGEAGQAGGSGDEPELTIPQLFGFIHEELSRDIPENWDSIIVEAEVFEEDGRQAVSMVTWYTTPEEPEPVRFVPENTIGPMNALIELNKQNAPQGKPWRRIHLVYHTNGTVDVDTDSEVGT